MLVLTRKVGEAVIVGGEIRITVTALGSGRVRIGIEAPPHVTILRSELSSEHTGPTAVVDETRDERA